MPGGRENAKLHDEELLSPTLYKAKVKDKNKEQGKSALVVQEA
jgi:hypothetical protein